MSLIELFEPIDGTDVPKQKNHINDIAIIGASVKLPMADNLNQFWEILINRVNTVRSLPLERKKDCLRRDALLRKKDEAVFYEGSFLSEVDKFDADFFGCMPREADYMSITQRLLLTGAVYAIEDANYTLQELRSSNTGVFVGYIGDSDGTQYMNAMKALLQSSRKSMAVPGNLASAMAGRIAHFLDLHGPAYVIDTACSSSLTALHTAILSLRAGECEQALVGASRVIAFPESEDFFLGMESPDGVTRAFDNSANGTGVGEGVVCLLIKPLNKAIADNDSIYAVISGSAINHDGATLGITAPNADAQEKVLESAWRDAGVSPEDLNYIETHGTGTKLGDPIEITAIERAIRKYTSKKQFCPIGSVKTNIGHLYEASGLVSVIKAILCIQNCLVPPTRNFYEPNGMINFVDSPVYLTDQPTPLPKTAIIGVSSFGFSGSNCHVVLKSPLPKTDNKPTTENNGFIFSAPSEPALIGTLQRFLEWLTNGDGKNVSLPELSTALKYGRTRHNTCIKLEAQSHQQLVKQINYAIANLSAFACDKPTEKSSRLVRIHMPNTMLNEKRHWFTDSLSLYDREYLNTFKYVPFVSDACSKINNMLLICPEKERQLICAVCGKLPYVTPESATADAIFEVIKKFKCKGLLLCEPKTDIDILAQLNESRKRAEMLVKLAKKLEDAGIINSQYIVLVSRNQHTVFADSKHMEYSAHYTQAISGALRSEFAFEGVSVFDVDDMEESIRWVAQNGGTVQHKHIIVRNGKPLVKQLEPICESENSYTVSSDKCYIIFGGLGGIGSTVARCLAANGARHIITAQRSKHNDDYEKLSEQLLKYRCKLQELQCNICDKKDIQKMFEKLSDDGIEVAGIVHCAGSGGGSLLRYTEHLDSETIISPKIEGLLNLERVICSSKCCRKIDFLMLSSSAITFADIPGQGQYTVGNTFMDSYASKMRMNGIPAITVDWTAWNDVGIAKENNYMGQDSLIENISSKDALELIPKLLSRHEVQVVVGKVHYDSIDDKTEARLPIKLLLNNTNKVVSKTKQKQIISVHSIDEIQIAITKCITDITGLECIGGDDNLLESGGDSIILSRIHESIDALYPGTILLSQMFVYPTVNKLSEFIYKQLSQNSADDLLCKVQSIDDAIELINKM